MKNRLSRRKFVRIAAVITPALALAACGEQVPETTTNAAGKTTASQALPSPTTAIVPATTTPTSAITSAQTDVTINSTGQATQTANVTGTIPANTSKPAVALAPTPTCSSKSVQTMAEEEGPYFKPSSPQRTSLIENGASGTKLIISGYVLSTECKPVKSALLDFWQADPNGQYDLQGFGFRGHQFTDENGRFYLETVVPGLYPGRTRHIHVKVQAPNQPILTTQLYFPGEPRNQTDRIFNQALLMNVDTVATGKQGNFNFVLNLA